MTSTVAVGGLLDPPVAIAPGSLPPDALPEEPAISAITLAELAAGPHATDDEDERARRQDRVQRVEALLDPLPFDAAAARAYARVFAATRASDRKPRGARAVDLMIAAVPWPTACPCSHATSPISSTSRASAWTFTACDGSRRTRAQGVGPYWWTIYAGARATAGQDVCLRCRHGCGSGAVARVV